MTHWNQVIEEHSMRVYWQSCDEQGRMDTKKGWTEQWGALTTPWPEGTRVAVWRGLPASTRGSQKDVANLQQ